MSEQERRVVVTMPEAPIWSPAVLYDEIIRAVALVTVETGHSSWDVYFGKGWTYYLSMDYYPYPTPGPTLCERILKCPCVGKLETTASISDWEVRIVKSERKRS